MSHKKFGPDRFSRFDVYWIQTDKQTNRQTDRQAKFIYRCAGFIIRSITLRRLKIHVNTLEMRVCEKNLEMRELFVEY